MALERLSQSGELIRKSQRLRLQEIRRGKGSFNLSGWHLKALVRECGEPVVLRLSKRGTGWHMSVAVSECRAICPRVRRAFYP